MAREIAQDINAERSARGLPAIPFDAGAYSSGAQRVAENNRDAPCHACHSTDHPSGEVVWWGSDYGSSGSTIWWMGSPSHRALLLAPNATKLGVGVACNGAAHDAVAWIETTTSAQGASPTPVATKSGTGTRCGGRPSTQTTRAAPVAATTTPPTTTAPARRPNTSTTAAARSATTRTTAPRRTTTTASRRALVAAAFTPAASGGNIPEPVRAFSSKPQTASLAFRPTAGSRPVVASGFGAVGTASLVGVFVGVLALGKATRRNA